MSSTGVHYYHRLSQDMDDNIRLFVLFEQTNAQERVVFITQLISDFIPEMGRECDLFQHVLSPLVVSLSPGNVYDMVIWRYSDPSISVCLSARSTLFLLYFGRVVTPHV